MDIWQYLTIAMAVATSISLILAFCAYYRPRKRQKILYQITGIQYFEERDYALPSNAIMTFQSQEVKRLAETIFIIWNGGIDALRGEDIVEHDPIRISLPANSRLLSYSIIGGTNEGNLVEAQPRSFTSNEVSILYDYLNPGDGLVIKVLHDAKKHDPALVGAAKGLSGGPRGLGTVELDGLEISRRRLPLRVLKGFLLSTGMILIVIGTLRGLSLVVGDQSFPLVDYIWLFAETRSPFRMIWMIILGIMYASIPSYELWVNRRRYPKSLGRFLQIRNDNTSEK